MRLLGDLASVPVCVHRAAVFRSEARCIVAHREHHLIGDKSFFHKLKDQPIRHFPDDDPGVVESIRLGEHLPNAHAVGLWAIGLDLFDRAGLPAPGVIDQQLGVDAEKPVEKPLVPHGLTGHIAHCEHVVRFELSADPLADAPKICQRTVIPQVLPVSEFVQLRDADAVLICGNVLGIDVHGDLAEIEIAADPCGGGDAGRVQHILYDHAGKVMGAHAAGPDIIRGIHEHLVNGVDVHIVHRDVFEINIHDPCAVFHVVSHARRRCDIIQLQRRIPRKLLRIPGLALEHMSGRTAQPLGVDFLDALHHLEQSGAAGDAVGFEGGRDGKTDRFLRAAGVGHDKIGRERVARALPALDGGIEALEVNGDIGFVGHRHSPSSRLRIRRAPANARLINCNRR